MLTAGTGEAIVRMIVALLGGALIGLERERARLPEAGKDVPGLRTFGLLAMYGSILGMLPDVSISIPRGYLISISLPSAIGFLVLYLVYVYQRIVRRGYTGLTTFIVMLLTFIIGFLSGMGLIIISASASILVTFMLSLKGPIEKLISSISYNELLSLLEISMLALVIGPIVSSVKLEVMGINLFKIYLFFVIILSLSFTSYLALKVAGTRGFKIASVLSGLVNSEAAISASSETISGIGDERERIKFAGVAAALIISAMELRTIFLIIVAVYIFAGLSLTPIDIAILILASLPAATVLFIEIKEELPVEGFHPESPLAFKPALKTVLAYLVLTFAVKATSYFSGNISVIVAAVGGLANAGAAILGLVSSYPQIPMSKVIAGSLLSISSASLNKIIYADITLLGRKAWRAVVSWSILLALPSLILGMLYLI